MNEDANIFAAVRRLYRKSFGEEGKRRFVSYGRLEIIGNHTDHNHGHCIVAGCSLGIRAYVSPTNDGLASIVSDGYGRFSFPVEDLERKDTEKGTSIALTRGVLKGLWERGYKVGGFRAALSSNIFAGAGVSSSAAYELLIGEIINALYNQESIARIELAKVGQFSENVYFGKPSGLLDQTGSSFGGVQFLDFKDLANPVVEPLTFPKWPLRIVLVNPGASHAGLSDLYGTIPSDMKDVAKKMFAKEVLREVNPASFWATIRLPFPEVSERAKLRAIHFMEEDARTLRAKLAFESQNLDLLLEQERETQLSCDHLLKNTMIPGFYKGSPQEAVDLTRGCIGRGAARMMGGGFVGSIICFVLDDDYPYFEKTMKSIYGEGKVIEVSIPETGAHEVR
jgi:galactokinase